MDITEVPLNQDGKGKKSKSKRKNVSQEGNGEGSGVETKEKMETNQPVTSTFPPTFSVSEIKNKQRRHFMFMKLKQEKRKVRHMNKMG